MKLAWFMVLTVAGSACGPHGFPHGGGSGGTPSDSGVPPVDATGSGGRDAGGGTDASDASMTDASEAGASDASDAGGSDAADAAWDGIPRCQPYPFLTFPSTAPCVWKLIEPCLSPQTACLREGNEYTDSICSTESNWNMTSVYPFHEIKTVVSKDGAVCYRAESAFGTNIFFGTNYYDGTGKLVATDSGPPNGGSTVRRVQCTDGSGTFEFPPNCAPPTSNRCTTTTAGDCP
ncbi:MAG TPA: hypothetical protein VI072_31965 [Polyangiaceae bacterium]